METFNTEKEAQELVDEINSKEPTEFCPLAMATCRVDCVCWLPARLHKTVSLDGNTERVETFRVITGGCTNSMFFGE